jgi:PAS domain S-box-containing protein
MRRLLTLLVVATTSAAHPRGAHAQALLRPGGARALTQYAVDRWDDRQGLPQNSVQALAQTRDGYLWLGTQSGLVRFDGMRFTTWGRNTTPALPRPYIWALAPDRDGSLWIGTEEGGLVHFAGGRFTAYTPAQGLPESWVASLRQDRAGTLWIGTLGGGLARLRAGRVTALGTGPGRPGKNVMAIQEDPGGTVWIGSEAGLHRVSGDTTIAVPLPPGSGGVKAIAPARGGGLWLATGAGLQRYEGGRVTRTYAAADGLPAGTVTSLWEDGTGSLWIAGSAGLARLAGARITPLPPEQLPRVGLEVMLADAEGNLWLGTSGAGVARLRESEIVPFGSREGLPSDAVYPVMQTRGGSLWVGTADAGLAVVGEGGRVRRIDKASGALPSDFVFSLAQDSAGAVWVGTMNGLVRMEGERLTRFGKAEGLLALQVRAIAPTGDGTLWIGTGKGLQRLLPAPAATFTRAQGLLDDFVATLYLDRDGSLWIGSRQGVTHLDRGRFTRYSRAQGLPDAVVSALHRTRDGTLWAATGAGLARLRGGRFQTFGADDGLCDEELNSLLEDRRGRLWLSSNRGIFALAPGEVDAYARRALPRLPCSLYGRAEGMPSRETNGGVNPAGWATREGSLVFPTIGGLAAFDPERLRMRLPAPPVAIEEVLADGRPVVDGQVRAGTHQLEVHFTALSFRASEKIRFRYRLEGLDDEWVDAGTRRTAYYSPLPPGRYTLRVSARHPDGGWSEGGPALELRVRHRFHETLWFRLGAAALVPLVAFAAYRRRIERLVSRQRALMRLVDERTLAEARFRDLFDNAADAVFTTDAAGRVTALNRRAQQITGYDAGQARDLPLRTLLPDGEAGTRAAQAWMAGAAAGLPTELVARDGARVPVEVSTRIVEEDGVTVGTQAIVRDVRDRNELEQQLRQAQKMEAVGQLAGGVAHDFNNLLTVIRGGSELVLHELPAGSEVRDDVEMVINAANRATALTRQLLAFSRKEVVQPRPLDLHRVVQNLVPMLRRMIGEHIAIAAQAAPEPAWIVADPGQVEQVLVNLAVNARDAMPAGGTLTIRTGTVQAAGPPGAPPLRHVRLSVTDTGQGMDEATQARIFEPFFTTKPAGLGTGLGLSTVYGIVQQAGGTLRCISSPGAGTTFQIQFPFAAPGAAADGHDPAGGEDARPGSETILLVEDDAALRKLAVRILEKAGYAVLAASEGAAALQAAAAHKGFIDLLVTDMVMPGMSGRALADALKARRPRMRVLLMSGYSDDERLRPDTLAGETRFLQKPFTVEGLAAAVREVLDQAPAPGPWDAHPQPGGRPVA